MERFVELYESVYHDMYRLAYYYLGNAHDAEDAVGEAVVKAYEHFGKLRNREAFRGWILKILVNQCKTQLRKKSFRKEIQQVQENSYQPALEADTVVEELLGPLSDEERRIVALSVFGGYKGEEIAVILHMKHSTLRLKYRRALKKLEKSLREQ